MKNDTKLMPFIYDQQILEEKAYWLDRLSSEQEISNIRLDYPRPLTYSGKTGLVPVVIPEEMYRRLNALTKKRDFLLYVTLAATLMICLHKYSAQSSIIIGSPTRKREDDAQQCPGWLPIIETVEEEQGFQQLLSRLRQTLQDAYARRRYPFTQLVEDLGLAQVTHKCPLFDVALVLQGLHDEVDAVANDMTWYFAEADERPGGHIAYNAELYQEDSIKYLAQRFLFVLDQVLSNLNIPIRQISITTPDDLQLLKKWNETARAYPEGRSLGQCFEDQVERTPDAVAAVFEAQHLTYQQLNQRANQLAHYLRRCGVQPETRVGLCVERSLDLVIGVLGVLKSGGAYIPIDPNYPQERIQYIFSDAEIHILLTQQQILHQISEQPMPVMCLDTGWQAIASESTQNLACCTPIASLTYVMYTSGSTGTPKGVLVTHRGLVNLATAQIAAFGVQASSHVLQFASFGFDASISEIAMALLAGATLYLCPQEALQLGHALTDVLQEYAISVVTLPPSVLAVLPDADKLTALRSVISAGEACSQEIVARWAQDRRFLNAYGPTEGTVCSTIALCQHVVKPPIGTPMANMRVYVCDRHMRLVPAGVIGEAYIAGVGLARGYLKQPALTAERFLPDPFNGEPGARVYRTGDLVRYLPDGNIEYIGRNDSQVKIRGYRIELGEIEAVLKQHPALQDCIVVPWEGHAGDKRLVAYALTDQAALLSSMEVKTFAQKWLPDYMVPSLVMLLDAFPLTPNGKVDRNALPAITAMQEELDDILEGPRNELEQFLHEVWKDALDIDQIGIHTSFFDLGGESITAAIMINKLQERLAVPIHVVTIFDAPTIAELAQHLNLHYPEVVSHLFNVPLSQPDAQGDTDRVSDDDVAQLRQLIPSLSARGQQLGIGQPAARPAKNPPAIFVLSPPRSGSTLLRVMLSGHPGLFVPPELELLSFHTLQERHEAFSGRNSFWLEGTIRAIMDIKNCDGEVARAIMEDCEKQGMTTQQFYQLMQSWIGERLLVDKTPAYAMDQEVLQKSRDDFADTYYVHLIRHPYGMIRSFEDAKIDQSFFRYPHAFSTRKLAELIWVVCQQNILEFLESVPAHRKYALKFEDLVRQPREEMEGLCAFLGIDFREDMLRPYESGKMTDGIHPLARMLGDIKFHDHRKIDANIADRWKDALPSQSLGKVTCQLAEFLNYERQVIAPEEVSEQEKQETLTPIPPLPRDAESTFPLSFAQQRLWFLDQLTPDDASYNAPSAIRLQGVLQVEALERSLDMIIQRHEILRTTLHVGDGAPVQVIQQQAKAYFRVVDLSGLCPEDALPEQRRALSLQEARQPFELSRGPMLRATLLRLQEQEHVLLFTVHHIVSDAWSSGILVREITRLYNAYVEQQPCPLPPLPLQYADYAVWQREWLQGEELAKQMRYWLTQLDGVPPLDLPTDHPRPPVQTSHGTHMPVQLSSALTEQLKQLSQREGVTLFMTLLAAFQVLLARYSRQNDIAIGTPIANRTRAETEGLIGFFVNTLVLRTNLSSNPSGHDLLQRVRQVALEAYAHQELPFEQVVEALQPERDLSHAPLFQVLFNLQSTSSPALELQGLQTEILSNESGIAKFDLTLSFQETAEGLSGVLEYNTDLLEAATITRMVEHLRCLLAAMVADLQAPVMQLPLLDDEERAQIVQIWNATQRPFPQQLCLHQLFEAQVVRTPDAIAVAFEDEQVSYRELNRRANQLAHHLQKRGVGPEVLVGIYLAERSPEMIVGVLGILKAGGAYLPLDPATPQPRLAFMLSDARVSVVLTRRSLLQGLSTYDVHAICLETDWEIIAGECSENPTGSVQPENLAYVMYTSGSTGQPKGVCIPHVAVNRLVNNTNYVQVEPSEGVAHASNPAFDAATFEIWGALLHGARLIGISKNVTLSPQSFAAHLEQQGARVLFLTTALFNQIASEVPQAFRPLHQLLFGGELVDPKWVKEVLSAGTPERLLHVYGPTESTTFSSWHLVQAVANGAATIPIGHPISNTQIYLLDAWLQPVPINVPGELYIGGSGLARGYLNRPELTAERFIPNPFAGISHDEAGSDSASVGDPSPTPAHPSCESGARLYRTGDLARYLPDGSIEFLGRVDHQIKLRGFRIELGEIEAVLIAHTAVREAVVVLHEDTGSDKRLVAYVVPSPERTLTRSDLRSYMQARLPDYMLPSTYMLLESLPLTPNGKVDRRRLPAPDGIRPDMDKVYMAPQSPIEEQLANIWTDVLHLDRVGIHDDFFELGGHSLLATQVVSRVKSAFGVDLPLRSLFKQSNVADLAQTVAQMVDVPQSVVSQRMSPVMIVSKESEESLLARLDQLSTEEVDTLLASLLSEGKEKN